MSEIYGKYVHVPHIYVYQYEIFTYSSRKHEGASFSNGRVKKKKKDVKMEMRLKMEGQRLNCVRLPEFTTWISVKEKASQVKAVCET